MGGKTETKYITIGGQVEEYNEPKQLQLNVNNIAITLILKRDD